jgi:hypothetical protein
MFDALELRPMCHFAATEAPSKARKNKLFEECKWIIPMFRTLRLPTGLLRCSMKRCESATFGKGIWAGLSKHKPPDRVEPAP